MSKKTTFNLDWVDPEINPQWKEWLRSANDVYKATCILCSKTFSLSNMGRQAVSSHEASAKHVKNVKAAASGNLSCFFKKASSLNPSSVNELGAKETEVVSSKSTLNATTSSTVGATPNSTVGTTEEAKRKINFFFSKDDTLKAEIIWALKLVMSHSSFNSFKDASSIFKLMFPDSQIAQTVTMSRTKMSYLVVFGLAPYFNQVLLKQITDSAKFVICFDEALNRVAQKGQMDLVIRFWNSSTSRVESRYLTSVFLGHSTAEDLLKKFREGLAGIPTSKLIQVSMDGPTVNHKFLRILIEEEKESHLFDLGTCELHIVHGAFRTGHKASGWNLNAVFRAFYQLFKDSPARRADFISLTETSTFPLKFCQVRWIENVDVAERAIKVFPHIKKYVGKSTLPQTATAENVKSAVHDNLMLAKIAFFSSVAAILKPFLTKFQTSMPAAPYLYDATVQIIQQLMKRCIKSELIEGASTPLKLLKIDLTDKANWGKLSEVDIGIAASGFVNKSPAKEADKKKFLRECRAFLLETVKKIIERSPLNFPIVKAISCLDPKLIISNAFLSKTRMKTLLELLNENGHVTALSADRAKQQFDSVCYKAAGEFKESFQTFTRETRLDDFYITLIGKDEEFRDLINIIKMVLTFSHGNATVESGFSINKDMLVENMHEKSLIALRTVYDGVKSNGGIENVKITEELMNHSRMSRTRYSLAAEERKKEEKDALKEKSAKRKILDQIKCLKQKKAKLSSETFLTSKQIEQEISELSKHL